MIKLEARWQLEKAQLCNQLVTQESAVDNVNSKLICKHLSPTQYFYIWGFYDLPYIFSIFLPQQHRKIAKSNLRSSQRKQLPITNFLSLWGWTEREFSDHSKKWKRGLPLSVLSLSSLLYFCNAESELRSEYCTYNDTECWKHLNSDWKEVPSKTSQPSLWTLLPRNPRSKTNSTRST